MNIDGLKKKKDKILKKKLKEDDIPNLAVLKVCGHNHGSHGWMGWEAQKGNSVGTSVNPTNTFV